MPGLTPDTDGFTGTNMYHSFDYANSHFVAITTEPSTAASQKGTAQYTWLEKDLQRAGTVFPSLETEISQRNEKPTGKLIGSSFMGTNRCTVPFFGMYGNVGTVPPLIFLF